MPEGPIGIFDSGLGGLSIVREVRHELPAEDLLYVADSAHAPYGDKPAAVVEARTLAVAKFLIGRGAKALVVACNTATGVAVDILRRTYAVPIVGIEPAVKPAIAATRSGVIGVLATSRTLESSRFEALVSGLRDHTVILTQACPGLVECIEQGQFSAPATRALIERYVAPLVARGADTLVLGCTHYPLVSEVIQSVAGAGVCLVDPARPVAAQVRRRLRERGLLTASGDAGTLRVYTNGDVDYLRAGLPRFGLQDVDVEAFRDEA